MDLNDMRIFLAVVQTGGITAAAQSLFISQPTISYRIKNLEKELGVRLFQRGQGIHNVDLTPAGERLVDYAQRWVDLSREIQNIQSDIPEFELQLGCVDSLNLYLLMPLYESLSRAFPSAKIRIRTQQSLEIYHMVETRELDGGFVLRELESDRFHLEPVFAEKMQVVRKRTGLPHGKQIQPQELDRRKELYIEWSPSFVQWHNIQWDVTVPPYLWIDSVPLMRSFLQRPGIWSICPESVIASLSPADDLEILDLAPAPPDRITYFVTHAAPTGSVKRNLDLFREAFDPFLSTLPYRYQSEKKRPD
ncbi:MAG: LysR family transcriptional regulator [Oscillibacter sp.]|jgi:DNA-binding transcriptional LysR family regulator|nr:LysR family transcriptional regulator [Oscillibacter sp.]